MLVQHQTDCCGSIRATAIDRAAQGAFDVAEGTCREQYPACRCAVQPPALDDGTMISGTIEEDAMVECLDGLCRTRFKGETFACGDRTCTGAQYCSITSGGPAGSPAYHDCVTQPSCAAACGGCSVPLGCSCAENQGHVTVTCAHP